MAEFLDLAHRYALLNTEPENHARLNSSLIGRPRVDRPTLVDERAGFVPPSWWRGDDYASRSGVLAAATLTRRH